MRIDIRSVSKRGKEIEVPLGRGEIKSIIKSNTQKELQKKWDS